MPQSNAPALPFRAGVLLGIAAGAIIVGYSLYAALPYLLGPSLSVTETSQNGDVVITGTTKRVSFLSIDDAPVPLEEDGSFSAERAYPAGYTTIKVSVKDRFGRTLTKLLTFVNK